MRKEIARSWQAAGKRSRSRRRGLTRMAGLLVAGALVAVIAGGGFTTASGQGGTTDPPASESDLAVAKSDSPDPVITGRTLTYSVEVENLGPDPATGVTMTDTLPRRARFLSATTSAGACDRRRRKLTCDLGTLASDAISTVTIQVQPRLPAPRRRGRIRNIVRVSSEVEDPRPANDQDTEITVLLEGPTCQDRRATIIGTGGDDTLLGTGEHDVIVALGGHDFVNAGPGPDLVCVAGGNDFVVGGKKRDIVLGGTGGDRIKGRRGRDRLRGDRGRDRLKGGRGRDLLAGGRGRDRCKGGRGDDTKRSC
jgi:uncharacterized repeat protein (TIGR01451 family)